MSERQVREGLRRIRERYGTPSPERMTAAPGERRDVAIPKDEDEERARREAQRAALEADEEEDGDGGAEDR